MKFNRNVPKLEAGAALVHIPLSRLREITRELALLDLRSSEIRVSAFFNVEILTTAALDFLFAMTDIEQCRATPEILEFVKMYLDDIIDVWGPLPDDNELSLKTPARMIILREVPSLAFDTVMGSGLIGLSPTGWRVAKWERKDLLRVVVNPDPHTALRTFIPVED